MDLARDIHPLTDFKRETPRFVELLEEEGRAVLLTVNGKASLAAMGAATFQRVLAALELLDSLRELRRGIGQAEAGRTLPLEEVDRILMWSQGS